MRTLEKEGEERGGMEVERLLSAAEQTCGCVRSVPLVWFFSLLF